MIQKCQGIMKTMKEGDFVEYYKEEKKWGGDERSWMK
jgi:hypothetical protein